MADNYGFNPDDFIKCVDDNDIVEFLALIRQVDQDGQIDNLSLPIFKDVPLLHYMCRKDHILPEFVKTLLHNGISVDSPSEEVWFQVGPKLDLPQFGHHGGHPETIVIAALEKTSDVDMRPSQLCKGRPIHVACIYNCPKTVTLLLEYNAKVIQGVETAWDKQSPFYIASYHGYLEVVHALISHAPKYIKDEGIRSCLLYAGCLGGRREIVNIWYSPGMDINHPRVYIDDPGPNCSEETPLFAACSGNHYEVAQYLVELGAEMTCQVCEDFPEITGRILKDTGTISLLEDESDYNEAENLSYRERHVVNYSKRDLGFVNGFWLQPLTYTLVELDISRNKVERLPGTIPWSFPNLTRFNATNNLLSSFGPPEGQSKCERLAEIYLSNNRLTSVCLELFQLPQLEVLNLSQNRLEYLVKTHQQQFDWQILQGSTPKVGGQKYGEWSCSKLSRLNLSHNELKMLPPDIKRCTSMTVLDASHNNIITFPGAWDCSLSHLLLSHNNLETFPADIHMYWCGSLRVINLANNDLDSLKESVVKLCALTDLIASDNKICRLPEPSEWDCKQLYSLNLKNNMLGLPCGPGSPNPVTPKRGIPFRISKVYTNMSEAIVLPLFLEHCLHDLILCNNSLDCVPKGICHLSSLVNLDISQNPGIKELPKEMGHLHSCSNLITDVQRVPGFLGDVPTGETNQKSKELISHLRHELRKSKHYNKLKLVILGKKDKGKTTLAGLLSNSKMVYEECGIQRFNFTLPGSIVQRQVFDRLRRKPPPDISFSVWDMSSSKHYTAVQQCFFTKNSLYLLVWDIWSLKKELDKLGNILYSIEAQTPHSQVILVATFLDGNVTSERDLKVAAIVDEVVDKYGIESKNSHLCCRLERDNIIPVSCSTKEGIPELKQKLYEIASKIPDPSNRPKSLISRKIPQSYFEVEKAVTSKHADKVIQNLPPFLENEEFQELIKKIHDNDITTQKEIESVTEFLVESGSMLHFSDRLKGLNNLYFVDPSWLCELLAKVLIDGNNQQLIRGGKIGASQVKVLFEGDSRFPIEYLEQYIQLLERFEIALSVDSGKKYFVPSQLSENPGLELYAQDNMGKKVSRLYQMAFIPSGFWTRLLSRIMARIEILESRQWVLAPPKRVSRKIFGMSRMAHTAVGREFSGSCGGLRITEKDMVYWQDGMCVRHHKGFFQLESIRIPQIGRPPQDGVIVVVSSHEEDFSIMGMIIDEIDDLIIDHYPGLSEWDEHGHPRVQRFALCPQCYDSSSLRSLHGIDHFTVEHCSRLILKSDTISCKGGFLIPLKLLVPELLIQELPKQYHLDKKYLEVDNDKFLGRGVSGSVFKGKYQDNIDVAVKYYHDSQNRRVNMPFHSLDSGTSSTTTSLKNSNDNSADEPVNTDTNRSESADDFDESEKVYANFQKLMSEPYDTDEASSIKTLKAFMDMRQEVAVTSKLQHPCVVAFVGICIRPQLLMCLEFAPLGNLRDILDAKMKGRKKFNKYKDKDKIFDTVFSKDMAYKVILQIALGLEYLHKNSIIYRDLKSENILVKTMEMSAPVNIKLSDYGISKFYHSGGNVGLVGTPGYQAPEIMEGLVYDEKVDIFSFAMVIYEILSGERPFADLKNLAQITRAVRVESRRPSLKNHNIVTHFPRLEKMMEDCWHKVGTERPSATTIIADYMKHIKFICQHEVFEQKHGEIECITPIIEGRDKKQLIWIWEGSDEDKRCYSIFDISGCCYHVHQQPLPGKSVTCMCKVSNEVWVATEGDDDTGVIEIFAQKEMGIPKLQNTVECTGVPTSILYVDNPEEDKKIYVTLHNGRLNVYSPWREIERTLVPGSPPVPSRRNTVMTIHRDWKLRKDQQISHDQPTCMIYVPDNDELWIGCNDQIIVYSNKTMLVETKFSVETILQQSSPQPINTVCIQSLRFGMNKVWCLLQTTTLFLEFDIETKVPLNLYDCDQLNPKSLVLSTKVNLSLPTDVSGTGLDSVEEEIVEEIPDTSNTPPPIPPRRSVSVNNAANRISDSSASDYEIVPPPIPPKRGSLKRLDEEQVLASMSPVPARRRIVSSSVSSSSVPAVGDRKYATLPARSRRHHLDSCSTVFVNSLTVVGDTLWVGRTIGDILIININSTERFQRGEVITVLHCNENNQITNDSNNSIENLVYIPGRQLVISLVKDNITASRLMCWEAYTSENIRTIRKYWDVKKDGSSQPNVRRLLPKPQPKILRTDETF